MASVFRVFIYALQYASHVIHVEATVRFLSSLAIKLGKQKTR